MALLSPTYLTSPTTEGLQILWDVAKLLIDLDLKYKNLDIYLKILAIQNLVKMIFLLTLV